MEHIPQRHREILAVSGGQDQAVTSGRGQDDRVGHFQTKLLTANHSHLGNRLIQFEAGEASQPTPQSS